MTLFDTHGLNPFNPAARFLALGIHEDTIARALGSMAPGLSDSAAADAFDAIEDLIEDLLDVYLEPSRTTMREHLAAMVDDGRVEYWHGPAELH